MSKINNGKPHTCGVAILVMCASMISSACGGAETSSTTGGTSGGDATTATTTKTEETSSSSTSGTVPKAIFDIGEYGENIYEAVQANDWTSATNRLASLKNAVAQLPSNANSADKEQLDDTVNALDNAVSVKDQQKAQIEANQLTLEAINLSAPYNQQVPSEVSKLDYYGRELQIWSSANDEAKLKATSIEMRQIWDMARPPVESRDPAEAQKFDELVRSIEAATTPSQYENLAETLLEEVDNLEGLFASG